MLPPPTTTPKQTPKKLTLIRAKYRFGYIQDSFLGNWKTKKFDGQFENQYHRPLTIIEKYFYVRELQLKAQTDLLVKLFLGIKKRNNLNQNILIFTILLIIFWKIICESQIKSKKSYLNIRLLSVYITLWN